MSCPALWPMLTSSTPHPCHKPAEGRSEPQASRFDSSRQARWSRRPEQRQASLLVAGWSRGRACSASIERRWPPEGKQSSAQGCVAPPAGSRVRDCATPPLGVAARGKGRAAREGKGPFLLSIPLLSLFPISCYLDSFPCSRRTAGSNAREPILPHGKSILSARERLTLGSVRSSVPASEASAPASWATLGRLPRQGGRHTHASLSDPNAPKSFTAWTPRRRLENRGSDLVVLHYFFAEKKYIIGHAATQQCSFLLQFRYNKIK